MSLPPGGLERILNDLYCTTFRSNDGTPEKTPSWAIPTHLSTFFILFVLFLKIQFNIS